MSEIKYGLISESDSLTLSKTITLICDEFDDETINSCEVGLYNGKTSAFIVDQINKHGKYVNHTGIDNNKDGEPLIHFPQDAKLIIGDSNEVYNQIHNESLHLCFIDSCHCFSCVVSGFFCYSEKVKTGGYLAFHDTGKHIKSFKDFQHGDKENPMAYISVRKALEKIGLFKLGWEEISKGDFRTYTGGFAFELIFDEADETNEAGGICIFKKR